MKFLCCLSSSWGKEKTKQKERLIKARNQCCELCCVSEIWPLLLSIWTRNAARYMLMIQSRSISCITCLVVYKLYENKIFLKIASYFPCSNSSSIVEADAMQKRKKKCLIKYKMKHCTIIIEKFVDVKLLLPVHQVMTSTAVCLCLFCCSF